MARVQKIKGFTLIEILVVVAIIGILAVVVVINLDSSLARSRDSRRMRDINTVVSAMDMYHDAKDTYTISMANGSSTGMRVPANATVPGIGFMNIQGTNSSAARYNVGYANSIMDGLISQGYLPDRVTDPKVDDVTDWVTPSDQIWDYMAYHNDIEPSTKISVFAHLENINGSTNNSFGCSAAEGDVCGTYGMNVAITRGN